MQRNNYPKRTRQSAIPLGKESILEEMAVGGNTARLITHSSNSPLQLNGWNGYANSFAKREYHATLIPEVILIVIAAGNYAVPKSREYVIHLERAKIKHPAQSNVKAPASRHGKSVVAGAAPDGADGVAPRDSRPAILPERIYHI